MCGCQDVNREQGLLDMQQSDFPVIQTLMEKKQPYEQLWTTVLEFHTKSDVWMNGTTCTCTNTHIYYGFRRDKSQYY